MAPRVKGNTQPNWFLIGVFCVVIAFIFFMPFLAPIALSAVFASLLYPLFIFLSKHMNQRIAASLTMMTSILLFILPLLFISVLVIHQFTSLVASLSSAEYKPGAPLYEAAQTVGKGVDAIVSPEVAKEIQQNLHVFVSKTLPGLMNMSLQFILQIASSIPQLITDIIVYAFMFSTFLLHHKSIRNFIQAASPFSEDENADYFQKAGMIVTASLKGQFVIAFTTAVSSALLLFVLGFGPLFIPMTIVLTILGMVPLGSGIVVIPIALFNMLSGNFWPAFWVLLIYLLFICNIDTILRPHLIPKKAGMLPALTVLATFSGIFYFGLMGIVYGPLIVILLTTTAQIYLARQKDRQLVPVKGEV